MCMCCLQADSGGRAAAGGAPSQRLQQENAASSEEDLGSESDVSGSEDAFSDNEGAPQPQPSRLASQLEVNCWAHA